MGQAALTWTDVATVWAEKVPMSAREIVAAQGTVAERTTKFRIRFRSDVTERWRLVWNALGHDIIGVQPFGARKDRLELVCLEGIKDGR
jgi:SPP1 family predicted phage head-tail adaptor